MKESIYNITVSDTPSAGWKTIYNLLTKEYVCIRNDIQLNDSLPESYIQSLLHKGILILDSSEDYEKACSEYEKMCNSDVLSLTIFLTGVCNCKCTYCYETPWKIDDLKNPEVLSQRILDELNSRGLRKVFISFFGGEPLLNIPAIYRIAGLLHQNLQDRFSFSIVTNGTLLSDKDITAWLKLGLESIKVTVDGARNIHNGRRPYKNGNGTYDNIINNLAAISGRLPIIINIVLDQGVTDISGLLNDLTEQGIKAEFDLSFRDPLYLSDEEKSNLIVFFSEELKRRGFVQHSAISHPHGAVCMRKQLNSYGCTDTTIYGCIGNLDSVLDVTGDFKSKDHIQFPYRCKDCKYLPICFGGCVDKNDCNRSLFEIMVPALLKVYIVRA